MSGLVGRFETLKHIRQGSGSADEVNELLSMIASELANSTHCWFKEVGQWHYDLAPNLPRRKSVPDGQLKRWGRALFILRQLPEHIRNWPADHETLDHLVALTEHPQPCVRLPAVAAIISIGKNPPYRAVSELLDECGPSGYLNRYVYGLKVPQPFMKLLVRYRADVWEALCVALAEVVYGKVLAAIRNETLCANGNRPDIVVADDSVDRDGGRIVWADRMIDAKSGAVDNHAKYAPLCRQFELWCAYDGGGTWDKKGRRVEEVKIDGCTVVYRGASELAGIAESQGADDIAEDIAAFSKQGDHVEVYLRFLKHCLERAPTLEDLVSWLGE